MHCPHCESNNPADAAYCSSCGALLKKCPNCGGKMVDAKWLDRRSIIQFTDHLKSALSERVHVCCECGMMMLFVEDPALFRLQPGQEMLPRPVDAAPLATDTLPTPAKGD